ncbi:glucose dehydrogenase [Veronia nyctiphanis]|uniref:Glucose dehydrogenase n=1 Tax=Veronia nyctiphanis TaxID=1278244 RepID=A0A4V1LSL3_9GAMM|nr:PQQ-dependent sugar dehydrogenase [Veronia nyctiphanis]RXJ72098.1 glucose dehydrogenase [Veronia nyctiphanis]
MKLTFLIFTSWVFSSIKTLSVILSVALCTPVIADTISSEKQTFTVQSVAKGLNHPWSMQFLPSGDMLVTEREGGLVRVSPSGKITKIAGDIPNIAYTGQGGLLGLALAPDFESSGKIFVAYSEKGSFRKSGTSVISAILANNSVTDIKTVFRMDPKLGGGRHFGSRLLVQDNYLFISLGDRGQRDRSQDLTNHQGSVIRINLDGSTPKNNPFLKNDQAKPEIYSFGHRNIQGMTLANNNLTLWTHEHGPQGGDELNITQAGKNYGWPTITYGVNYGLGTKIGKGTHQEGMEQPVHYWVPSIAPSGMTSVKGKKFKNWQNNLLLGSLKFGLLVRLELDENRVVHEERMLDGKYGRIRDVIEGPNGDIYLLTDSANGEILLLRPINDD